MELQPLIEIKTIKSVIYLLNGFCANIIRTNKIWSLHGKTVNLILYMGKIDQWYTDNNTIWIKALVFHLTLSSFGNLGLQLQIQHKASVLTFK